MALHGCTMVVCYGKPITLGIVRGEDTIFVVMATCLSRCIWTLIVHNIIHDLWDCVLWENQINIVFSVIAYNKIQSFPTSNAILHTLTHHHGVFLVY